MALSRIAGAKACSRQLFSIGWIRVAVIGRTISHHRIVEKIVEGEMGVVYKAEDSDLKRSVALKFLRNEVLESEDHKTRFLREAQAAAALDHPNICTVCARSSFRLVVASEADCMLASIQLESPGGADGQ